MEGEHLIFNHMNTGLCLGWRGDGGRHDDRGLAESKLYGLSKTHDLGYRFNQKHKGICGAVCGKGGERGRRRGLEREEIGDMKKD